MTQYIKYLHIILLMCSIQIYAQEGASSCQQLYENFTKYQACATTITFDNSVGNSSGETFATTCIGSNFQAPTWFFIKIKEPGNMNLLITQVANNGTPSDVDFVLWGPFENLDNICNKLIIANEKDCSYSPSSQETVNIPVSQVGDIYILLIDNYDNVPGQITLSQIGGTGATDCDFLSNVKIKDVNDNEITQFDYCLPETQVLVAHVEATDVDFDIDNLRFNYTWYLNNVPIANTVGSRENTNAFTAQQTGTYKVVISAFDFTDPPEDMETLKKSQAEIELRFGEILSLNSGPHSITICDYNKPYNDGMVVYNLEQLTQILTSSTEPITWEFSHTNQFTELITNPTQYINTTAFNFTIYVRGYFTNNPIVCYSNTVTINITTNVIEGSEQVLEKNYICDDSGYGIFDLTIREAVLEFDSTIKYYENIQDAIANNSNFITNPKAFQNTVKDQQKIYLQIPSLNHSNSVTNTLCNRILELPLEVSPFPVNLLSKRPYKICIDRFENVIEKAKIDTQLSHNEYEFVWYKEFDAINGNQLNFGNSNIFETDIPGNYSVKIINITNSALCATVANFSVRTSYVPENVIVEPLELIAFDKENTITVKATPASQDYQYMINNVGWQNDNVFYNVAPGVYQVSVRNEFGCGIVTSSFIIADYQKFFTPNNDGHNDTWSIKGLEMFDYTEVRIFDRHGKLLKDITNDPSGWDGTFNEKSLPSDDYWFTITYESNGLKGEYKGHFSLKR